MSFPDGSLMKAKFDKQGHVWRVFGRMQFYTQNGARILDLKELPRHLKRLENDDDFMTGNIKDLPPNLEVLEMPWSTGLTGDLKDLNAPKLHYIDLRRNNRIIGDLGELRPGLRTAPVVAKARQSLRQPRAHRLL